MTNLEYNNITLTIITICLNAESTIYSNIGSSNKQTYKNFEHIFIDGNSVDRTTSIINDSADINYQLISEKDDGIYHAMNKGLELAKGDYIMFLNADDIFDNDDVLRNLVNAAVHSSADIIISNIRYVDRNDLNRVIRIWKTARYSLSKLKYGWMPPHPGTLIRRTLINNVGGFNQNYRISGDYDLLVRIFKTKDPKVRITNIYSTKMRTGGASNSSIKNILTKMSEDYQIITANGIGNISTLIFKNLRKLTQFLKI